MTSNYNSELENLRHALINLGRVVRKEFKKDIMRLKRFFKSFK